MALEKKQIFNILVNKDNNKTLINDGELGKVKSNRVIAEEVIGNPRAESTVRTIWNAFEQAGSYRGVDLDWVDEEPPVTVLDDVQVEDKEEFTLDVLSESILNALISGDDKAYANLAKRLRTAQNTNNQLRKIHRGTVDPKGTGVMDFSQMLERLEDSLNSNIYEKITVQDTDSTQQKTVEILWGDWQWGKVSESWNTEIAERTSKYYGLELLKIIEEEKPERIIFAAMGDNIEDFIKHGVQSAVSTDTSNAEQMANCIEQVWFNILLPLVQLGIPMDFVGIVGNHGSSEHKGMDMYRAGRYCMDYTLYKTWETLCKTVGAEHVTFNLPEGHFATYEIYGKLTVVEHGYSCKGSSENALIALRNKRATNLQQFVHRLLVGDMHHYCNYDNGNLQVNGAAFGVAFDAIEFSGIMGFHAVPCQILNIHVPTTGVGQNTVLETKVIQVAKGYNFGL